MMKMKKLASLVLAMVMCLTLCVPAMAAERESVTIIVKGEEDILEFFKSPQYDSGKSYSFTYLNPMAMRILCPNCGYNTYRGKVEETPDPDPNKQGRAYDCPQLIGLNLDTVFEYIVTYSDYCATCGYERITSTRDKYYITCNSGEGITDQYVATERRNGHDMHTWLDWWDGIILR